MRKKKNDEDAPAEGIETTTETVHQEDERIGKTYLRKADGKRICITKFDPSWEPGTPIATDTTCYFGDGSNCSLQEFVNPGNYEVVPDVEIPDGSAAARLENADKVHVEIGKRSYPVRTTTRSLPCRFSPEEMEEKALRLSHIILEVPKLKSTIKTLVNEQTELAVIVEEGQEDRDVTCRWFYEVAGRDSNDKDIPSAGHKTLMRLDSFEVVEVMPMTGEDRQLELNYGGDKPKDELPLGDEPKSESDNIED